MEGATMGDMDSATAPPPDLAGWQRLLKAKGIDVDNLPEVPAQRGESAEDAAERIAVQAANRASRWRKTLPPMYAKAALTDLDPSHQWAIQDWIDRGGLHLILAGRIGAGKTHAAYALGHHLVTEGRWVEAWAVVDLLDALKPGREPDAEHRARECDTLILDDLGADRATEWGQERMLALLDDRVRNHRQTIVTTNAIGQQISDVWGARLLDRLTYRLSTVIFDGESRRKATW